MWWYAVELQREINAQVSELIKQFAAGSGWLALLWMLPMGVGFGAVHALTPGHSKAVLAAYVAGSPVSAPRALLTSLTLSLTHVTAAVLIAVLALPLVSVVLGSVGRAPALENVSRGLLCLVGLWMLWRACRDSHHPHNEGLAVGFFAGLIPCPLTLFVMTLAMARGVPQAGITFALAMMIGVALTLSAVALLATLFRAQAGRLLDGRPALLRRTSRIIEAAAGCALIAIAARELLR